MWSIVRSPSWIAGRSAAEDESKSTRGAVRIVRPAYPEAIQTKHSTRPKKKGIGRSADALRSFSGCLR
jgi:hypothetical protein